MYRPAETSPTAAAAWPAGSERWFARPQGTGGAPGRVRLFCFPHAGGGASAYFPWGAALPEMEVLALQLPGREGRLREPPFHDFGQLRAAVLAALLPLLDGPFVFFGHSMGALLAYELARDLARAGRPLPAHIYVSGRRSPLVRDTDGPLHALPDAAFADALERRFGGLPAVIRAEPELLALFLPILRADITALERHEFAAGAPLPVPITALGGTDDVQARLELLQAWAPLTSASLATQRLPGGHFYLHERRAEFLQALRAHLASHGWHRA
jgi:medium-chain acyl-[acyl-carrier-protein] hydrolase